MLYCGILFINLNNSENVIVKVLIDPTQSGVVVFLFFIYGLKCQGTQGTKVE